MDENKLVRKLSPINVCSLALGSIIGWGAFVMPGNVFLPKAGPVGTMLAMIIAACIMIIIAMNYSYMVNKFPSSGGECTYAQKAFGKKHAYVCTWFLGLSYISIVPLNATALALVGRSILGDVFQCGFKYQIAGYDIYFGEIVLAEVTLLIFAFISIRGIKFAGVMQTVLCFVLLAGVLCVMLAAIVNQDVSLNHLEPGFKDADAKLSNVLSIVAVAPWAFVGFDTIPQTTEEFGFPIKRTKLIMVISIIFGAGVYVILNTITALVFPEGCASWVEYIENIEDMEGILSLPTFYAGYRLLGNAGLVLLVLSVLGAVLSGILGFYTATSRLLYAMAREKFLPSQFRVLHKKYKTPQNAIVFVLIISLFAPFFGRTALGWIVDMSSLGAAIGYGYTSAATIYYARMEKNGRMIFWGSMGVLFSICFAMLLIVPIPELGCSLSNEAYICLGIWIALGLFFYIKTLKNK